MEQGKRSERQPGERRPADRQPEGRRAAERPPGERRSSDRQPSERRSAERPRTEQEGRTRTRRKRGGGKLLSNPMAYLLFVFGLSAILAALTWTAANDMLALNKTWAEESIVIGENDSYGSVVNQLKDKGIIEYKLVFRVYSAMVGGADKITPGAYILNTDMDYRAVISAMSARSGNRSTTKVTIREGLNVDEIFALLEESGVSSVAKLQAMAAEHDYAFSFLEEIPLGDYKRLEGYLFPDTYEFYMGEDARFVLNKMLLNFDSKLNDTLREKISAGKYSMRDIIIIASMIEKETDSQDYGKISSVIHNRLERPTSETVGLLNIDATLQYVLPEGEFVTPAHYDSLDSPYNTYKHQGLPPGPISNPGMESIIAAISPEDTGYYYYALGTDGKHHFSKTHAEHQAFLNQQ